MKKLNFTENIIDIIQNSKYALSHAQLQVSMHKKCNRVTTYRILERLVDQGVVHKIIDLDGVAKFASCNSCINERHFHNHIHFCCNNCNEVTCLEGIEPKITLPQNYIISQVNYTISGVCPECS